MNELMLERLGRPVNKYYDNEAMQIGRMREPDGVFAFELATGIETEEAGFMLSTCKQFGASPDRIWNEAVLELKCPTEVTHLNYLEKECTPSKYVSQLRGQMLVANKNVGYFVSYHPAHDLLIVKETRDPSWDAKFLELMNDFLERLEEKVKLAKSNLTPF